jgi:hypothetical protein
VKDSQINNTTCLFSYFKLWAVILLHPCMYKILWFYFNHWRNNHGGELIKKVLYYSVNQYKLWYGKTGNNQHGFLTPPPTKIRLLSFPVALLKRLFYYYTFLSKHSSDISGLEESVHGNKWMITRMAKESVKGPGKTGCDVAKPKGKWGRSCENLEEQTPQ